jgi:hypothetical protein
MDIALCINEYLKDKGSLRDKLNDTINIVDNVIVEWNFANIPQPTNDELSAIWDKIKPV